MKISLHCAISAAFFLLHNLHGLTQNAIINPGFEFGLTSWSQVNEGSPIANMSLENSIFHSGTRCGKVTLLQNDALGGFAQNVLLEAGATYEVKCYCKTDNLNGIALPYLNINNNSLLLEFAILPISGTTDWYEAKARFVSPNAASNATFFFFVQGSGGTAYIDDVSFTKQTNQGNAPFEVNTQNEAGTIRPFMDVNAGPILPPFSQNLSADFEDLGITSVRTHDFYGPCDLHTIFPDFNADANDPTSYDFEETDEVIAAIVATGAEVMFRLGESFSGSSLYNTPPSDNQKMAEICKNIVRHYNDGWNNGYTYNIEHWEIWNEPDLYHFWSGTAFEFTTMYGVIANTLKTYNSNLKIIGPAVSSMISEWFVDEFLAGVSQFNYPLDGFSYHMYYMANPYGFAQMDERVTQKLAQYGLEEVPHYLTEWNNYSYSSNGTTEIWRNDPFSGASAAASLIYLQETELVQAHRYRANEFLFGLFDDNSAITYSGMAYQQFSSFVDHNNRLTTSGGDSLGFAILAGRNDIGNELQLSIANNSTAHNSYSIQLNGLASNETYTYTQWRIDSTHTNQQISTGIFTAQAPAVTLSCSSPFVDKLILAQEFVDSVKEQVADEEIKLWPNPTSDLLQLSGISEKNTTCHYWIIDRTGKVVLNQRIVPTGEYQTIDVRQLAAGEYILLVEQSGEVKSAGWVKE